MKLRHSNDRCRQGNTLLVSLVAMMTIGLALLTFLTLAMNQNQLVVHTQVYNASLPTAEAGIEDALNHCGWNSTNWVSNGWALSATNTVYRSNTVAEGWYRVDIDTNGLVTNVVVITSTGYFPMPGSSIDVPRTVQVKALIQPTYKFAMLAKSKIKFNGNGTTIDSYDSTDPLKSTLGFYDPAKAGDKGDVACETGLANTFNIGNGNIWGHVYTGVGGNLNIGIGANGKIGSALWQATGPNGSVQPGWIRSDLNISLPDAAVPFNASPPPASGTVDGKYYDYVFGNGTYTMGTLDKLAIVTGTALVHVTTLLDSSLLVIKTNANLQLYCGAPSAQFDAIQNDSKLPGAFQFIGLPTQTSLNFKKDLIGAVFAPNSNLTLAGANTVYGSLVMNTFTLLGGADVHFDMSLSTPQKRWGFIIISWKEL